MVHAGVRDMPDDHGEHDVRRSCQRGAEKIEEQSASVRLVVGQKALQKGLNVVISGFPGLFDHKHPVFSVQPPAAAELSAQ